MDCTNENLNRKLNHICWHKEIVITVFLGRLATVEAHVLNDNRLQHCQCHQTDIRTLEQPFPTARSTIWHRRNGSNKVYVTSGLVVQCTHMQQIP